MRFPTSFAEAHRQLGGNPFARFPQGVQLQLVTARDGYAITVSVNSRRVFTHVDDPRGILIVHGDALNEALEGVLPAMNAVLFSLRSSGFSLSKGWEGLQVQRWHQGKRGVLTVKPAEDPAFKDTGTPYELSRNVFVTITQDPFTVKGTLWAPPHCARTDTCECKWCEGIRSRRSSNIAAMLAQFMGPAK